MPEALLVIDMLNDFVLPGAPLEVPGTRKIIAAIRRRIAFATNRWGDLEMALIDTDGQNLTRLTESPGLDDYPAWSPDGRWLAWTSNRDGNLEIYVSDADGRPGALTARSSGGGSPPSPASGGRWATRSWWATPSTPLTSPSARGPAWPWRTPSRSGTP